MMRELSSSPEPEEFEGAETELLSSEEQKPVSNSKKRKSKNKRRFSNEQVRSLEVIFELETKLDPRKKVQVARDLGLQPRQVAIWFQNKRARWKSKEIEKNYRELKANYDSLKAKFDATKKEKESLLLQLQELQNQLQNMQGGEGSEDSAGDRSEQNMDNIGGHVLESYMLEEELECREVRCFDDDHRSRNITCMGQGDGPQLLDMNEHMHTSLTAQAKWCSLDPGSLFDQPSSVSHWWDSWT